MDIIERSTNIAKSCILPQLVVKIGENFIGQESFAEFQPILTNNLQMLLDVFHANEHLLLTIDLDTLEFRKQFVLLLCEQSTDYNTVFQTSDVFIRETVKKVCRQHVQKICKSDKKLLQSLFEYYHDSLSKENWKYNIGAVNGFLTFTELLYGNIDKEKNLNLDYDKAQFILATGLNFLDHFEPNIQIIGIKLFNILLNESNRNIVVEYNMDLVILEDTQKLILKSKEIGFESVLWQCLYTCCLIGAEKYKPGNWSKFDDVFEELMQKLASENQKPLSLLYLSYVIRLSIFGESKYDVFNDFLDIHSLQQKIQTARTEISKDATSSCLSNVIGIYRKTHPFANFRILRWIKKLLLLLQNDVFNLGGTELEALVHLNELHILYCVTIFTAPPHVCPNFANYCKKLIASLLEVYQIFKSDNFIRKCVVDFLMTIQVHLSRVNDTELVDLKIAPLLQMLSTGKGDEQIQGEANRDVDDIQECSKALSMLLEKINN